MAFCAFIKPDSSRCKAWPIKGEQWCYVHHPELAETRSVNGAKGGRRAGRGRPPARKELAEIQRAIKEVIEEVRAKKLEPRIGAVAFQGYNCLLKAHEAERLQVENDELLEKVAQLEELVPAHQSRGRRGWCDTGP